MDDFIERHNTLSGLIDRLERVPRYLGCMAALSGSAGNLHVVNGDDLALLLDLITREADESLAAVRLELGRLGVLAPAP